MLSDEFEFDEEYAVVVPEVQCPLDEAQLQIFQDRMRDVTGAGPWDIEPYLYAMEVLHELLGPVA